MDSRGELAPEPVPPKTGFGSRLRIGAAIVAVAALVVGSILLPRLVGRKEAQSVTGFLYTRACQVSLPQSWRNALHQQVHTSEPGLGPQPFAVSPDGAEYFAEDEAKSWAGVVAVNIVTGYERRIEQFPGPSVSKNASSPGTVTTPVTQVFEGFSTGRWLVWEQSAGPAGKPLTQTIFTWDAATGHLHTVASTPTGSLTLAQNSVGGLIAWGLSNGNSYALSTAHLSDSSTRQVASSRYPGRFGSAFFWGGRLLFSATGSSFGPSVRWRLEALSTTTLRQVVVPHQLVGLAGMEGFDANSEYVAGWSEPVGNDFSQIHNSIRIMARGSDRAINFFSGRGPLFGPNFPGVSVFGKYLTWTEFPTKRTIAAYIADLTTGAYVKLPAFSSGPGSTAPNFSQAFGGGGTIIAMGDFPGNFPRNFGFSVLRLGRVVPLPGCGR
ncbi:MAG TPA: hypothetical protein VNF75_02085 [Candidatus Dormibacteraeota bacterium]|nr:hypothetical protein [Candidatus Dormibacteraeota bacterium]